MPSLFPRGAAAPAQAWTSLIQASAHLTLTPHRALVYTEVIDVCYARVLDLVCVRTVCVYTIDTFDGSLYTVLRTWSFQYKGMCTYLEM